jgi:antitoxin component of MazEF toxin-antitoxin module
MPQAANPLTVTVAEDRTLMLPAQICQQARIKPGEQMEVKVSGGIITLIIKLPSADDEYTHEQRRIIDMQLAEALEDVKQGHLHGPFETHQEMIKFLHGRVRKAAGRKSLRKTR